MADTYQPRLGDWYRSINGDKFEIVALDDDAATMEIQHLSLIHISEPTRQPATSRMPSSA